MHVNYCFEHGYCMNTFTLGNSIIMIMIKCIFVQFLSDFNSPSRTSLYQNKMPVAWPMRLELLTTWSAQH